MHALGLLRAAEARSLEDEQIRLKAIGGPTPRVTFLPLVRCEDGCGHIAPSTGPLQPRPPALSAACGASRGGTPSAEVCRRPILGDYGPQRARI